MEKYVKGGGCAAPRGDAVVAASREKQSSGRAVT